MRYHTRNNALTNAGDWVLEGSILRWEEEGKLSVTLLLNDVRAVHLEYSPTRPEPNRYKCLLELKSGRKMEFFNRKYQGVYDFTDTSHAYIHFVQGLHKALSVCNMDCVYRAGVSIERYRINQAVLLFVVLLVVLAAGMLLVMGLFLVVLIKLFLIAAYAPAALNWLRRNRPRQYLPENIPVDLLPHIAAR